MSSEFDPYRAPEYQGQAGSLRVMHALGHVTRLLFVIMLILGAIYLFAGMVLGDTFVQKLGATVLALLLCGWSLLWLAGRLYVSRKRDSGGSSQNSRPLD